MNQILLRWQAGDIDGGLSLLEFFRRDIHFAALARWYTARACQYLGKSGDAKAILQNLDQDLDALPAHPSLAKGLAALVEQMRADGNPILSQWLQEFQKDLTTPEGSLGWLRKKVKRELGVAK
jgi:hypothetical protein